jgi:hypothetical protein
MIQPREARGWIINFIPSETESGASLATLIRRTSVLEGRKAFHLAGTSPPNKKIVSLCPLCLRGEKSILDKTDIAYDIFIPG